MSLLDRVQRRGDDSPPAGGAPWTPERSGSTADAGAPPRPVPMPDPNAARDQVAPRPGEGPPGGLPRRPGTPPAWPAPGGATRTSLLDRTALQRAGGAGKAAPGASMYASLRTKVHSRLVEELAASGMPERNEVVARITELVNEVSGEQGLTLTRQERLRIIDTLTADVLGLGPLEVLLADPAVTEIMINGPDRVYVEQRGRITLSSVKFESSDQLMQVIDRIVSTIGRRVDESSPMCDARLKDGSRVNVIIPPLALKGPTVTIRKFSREALQVEDLVRFGSLTDDMCTVLRACVRARMNVLVSGGTGSGKTTTLNVLSAFIPADERIVTIEDAAELQLNQEHVVTLETRPANVEGRGRVTIRDLVINSLRMRPDRIVVGECRGGEALDMLQAMNTGHDGSLTTIHANNPRDCLNRLETLVLMAGAELPSRAIREQIGSAIDIIVQQSRLRDGTRKIVSITEVLGAHDGAVRTQEIFAFKQTGIDEDGNVLGSLMPTGVVPQFMEHLESSGESVDAALFQPIHVLGGEAASDV